MKKPAALVQITPRPTRCHRIEDPERVPELRQLDCRSYDQCLDHAAKQDWRGFNCNRCNAYQPLTAMERKRDHLALLGLLASTRLLQELQLETVFTDEQDESDGDTDEPLPRRGLLRDADWDDTLTDP